MLYLIIVFKVFSNKRRMAMRFSRLVPMKRITPITIGISRGHTGIFTGMARSTRPGVAV